MEEILTKLNKDEDNVKLLTKSLNSNNYSDFIIETILSSKSKKEEYKNKEKEEKFNILKEKNMENKKRRERIINEERYKNYLKELYKKNEKDDINRIIKLNSQKPNANNSEKKDKKRNFLNSENNNKEKMEDLNINNKDIVYKVIITVYNDEKMKVLKKDINISKIQHYNLDLDKVYNDIKSNLKILKINCKYGFEYRINNFEIKKNIGKINLLEYEILGYIQPKNDYYKEINLDINIISEKNISEKEALLNPQLYVKNDKKYKLDPSLEIINNSNLFKYNKGLEILLGNMSILFTNKNIYDLTNINLGELSYDGDTEIFFDETNFKKEESSFKELWDKNVCLIYNNTLGNKDDDNVVKYLNKRYSAELYDIKDGMITLITKIRNLLLTQKEIKNLSL